MTKKFKSYRSQILFVGLNKDEMLSIESSMSRYSSFYHHELGKIKKIDAYDLICISEEIFSKNNETLAAIDKPIILISERKLPVISLQRPMFVREWLEIISKVLSPAREPKPLRLETGSIVKSKTTPFFGKGVVTEVLNPDEVMVSFPMANIGIKNRSIRCHKTQLQIIGSISDIQLEESKVS